MATLFGNGPVRSATGESIGLPVDIAPSAYQYRADRRADANPPESWFALMHFAHLPLNQPIDRSNPSIRHALSGLLWEEIRPVQTLELTWPSGATRQPSPSKIEVTALIGEGSSSSWWNNLRPETQDSTPTVTNAGKTYTYALGLNTCGLVVSVAGEKDVSQYDVPAVRVLTPEAWKKMDLEIEWGFDTARSSKDYSGRIEAYDGRIHDLSPLSGDVGTSVTGSAAWRSNGKVSARRGIAMTLLYTGTSKWRKQQPYTTQPDDVARTIVTVWTQSGSFSFLAADLENGPILAPEYGFFVRRTSALSETAPTVVRMIPSLLKAKMSSIAGNLEIKGWGSDETPWFGTNPTDGPISALGITFPALSAAMHPGQNADVVAEWQSPIRGKVKLTGSVAHGQSGGNGIDWWVVRDTQTNREILTHGTTAGSGSQSLSGSDGPIDVQIGDRLALIVGPKGDHRCDTTIVDLTIAEVGGDARKWNLAEDIARTPHEGNPHADRLGNAGVWRFCSAPPMVAGDSPPSDPPIPLESKAASAREYLQELTARRLETIRERTREHPEQTWEGAVAGVHSEPLPPIPSPPAGSEPAMRVHVPSERLTAQWNLGAWHLVRHCARNPATGRLWFNDYPYGILAAETYLVLSVLDQVGSHEAAADGLDQWLSLPLDRDYPVGLFTEGRGSLTNAVGPDGYGGQMDGIHAFGPGSIGWAIVQHYWLTHDERWLKDNTPRILANADWMLRQRQVMAHAVPGGERLWCKGLQPPLQVTPDSGGLWMQFYECEAYYWAAISQLAQALRDVDPAVAAKLKANAESYRKDLKAAVERSITLSPVVPVRDGTFRSVIPFACYVRGLATGAWGWQRDGSGSHVGPLYWDTVQSADALVSPAGVLSPVDPRVQGYFDVLEDRLLLENPNVGDRDWFQAGWQYQAGLERHANMHFAADDIPVFLRSFLNCYAVEILPDQGYVFNEHTVHGPPDKIFEEAAFLERFRNLLVTEQGDTLWLARGTPRAWLEQGERISVQHAPTRFGTVDYEIVSDVANGRIVATVSVPSRTPPRDVVLRLRHPRAVPIKSVTVNGRPWREFDAETVRLHRIRQTAVVAVRY